MEFTFISKCIAWFIVDCYSLLHLANRWKFILFKCFVLIFSLLLDKLILCLAIIASLLFPIYKKLLSVIADYYSMTESSLVIASGVWSKQATEQVVYSFMNGCILDVLSDKLWYNLKDWLYSHMPCSCKFVKNILLLVFVEYLPAGYFVYIISYFGTISFVSFAVSIPILGHYTCHSWVCVTWGRFSY